MSRPEEVVLSLVGKYPICDAGWGCGAFKVSCCRGLVVSWVCRDVCVSPVFSNTCNWGCGVVASAGLIGVFRRERPEPIRFGFC